MKLNYDNVNCFNVEINHELYIIEEGIENGWGYWRKNQGYTDDDGGEYTIEGDSESGFVTHIEAVNAAMQHEKGRDELVEDIIGEAKSERGERAFWQWKCR